jgi:hypothetical protein
MRQDLGLLVAEILTNFATLSCRKVALNRSEEIDPSLQTGSGGILLALYRYQKLLIKETAGRPNSDLYVISQRLQDAIDMNISLIEEENL